MINPLTILILRVVAVFALGFGSAWWLQSLRQDSAELERIEATQEINRENARLTHRTATDFEKDRTQNETRTRTITVEIEKIVDRPVYRNVCIDDDGLRLLNAAIRRSATTGKPGNPMPGPATAD